MYGGKIYNNLSILNIGEEQIEKIDVEVKKAIVGLLRPSTSYVSVMIREARLS